MSSQLIATLESRRRTLYDEIKAITDKAAAENRNLTDLEAARFNGGTEEMTELRERIDDLRSAEDMNRRAEENLRNLTPADAAARMLGGADPFSGTVDTWLPSRRQYAQAMAEQRATDYTSASGVLLTQQFGTWFDRLRTRSVVLSAGPRLVPVDGHSLSVPVLASSATVGTYAENAAITDSTPNVDGVVLTPRKYAAMVLASNESLQDSSPALRDIIAADLMRSTATAVDADLLAGDGTSNAIKGMTHLAGTTAGATLGANGGVPDLDDILTMIANLEATGADLTRAAFFMTPGIWAVLRGAKRGTGDAAYVLGAPNTTGRPNLFGVPVYASANLPSNETAGTSTDCSHIVLADMDQVIVGVGKQVTVEQSTDYKFGSDQTAVRVVARFDLAALNPKAVVLTAGARASA